MNKTVKKQWVKALRSGKYDQAQEVLRTEDNKFCCLGVLCDLQVPNLWKKTNEKCWILRAKDSDGDIAKEQLPVVLQDRLNISSSQQEALIELNDSSGANFEEIASWIEENL